jgi:hypothetical protein
MMGMTPPPMGKPTNILPSNNNINVPPKQWEAIWSRSTSI